MKLISMTDFVLEQAEKCSIHDRSGHFHILMRDYANFLKQRLELWMFVPCDKEGRVIKCLENIVEYYVEGEQGKYFLQDEQYKKAKERVLFENIKTVHLDQADDYEVTVELIKGYGFEIDLNGTVEEVIFAALELTPTALKQIGL